MTTDADTVGQVTEAKGAADIAAERQRQIDVEGWTAERDDTYTNGSLALAAASYASHAAAFSALNPPLDMYQICPASMVSWPWNETWWKPKNARADLVRAGALIAAEIDRLDRLTPPTP